MAGRGSRGPLAPHDGHTMETIRTRPTRRVASAQGSLWGLDRTGVGVPGSWVGCRRAESICQGAGREGVARTSLGFQPEAQEEVGAGFQEQGGLWVHMCSGCARGAPREDVRDVHVCGPMERGPGRHRGTWERLGTAVSSQQVMGAKSRATSTPGGCAQPWPPTSVSRGHWLFKHFLSSLKFQFALLIHFSYFCL